MFGGMVFMGVVYAYKPDTRCVDGMLSLEYFNANAHNPP